MNTASFINIRSRSFWLTVFIYIGLRTKLSIGENGLSRLSRLINSVKGLGIEDILYFFGLLLLIDLCLRDCHRLSDIFRQKSILFPSFLFANFQVWGFSFYSKDNWTVVLQGTLQKMKSLYVIVTLTLLFGILLYRLYACLDSTPVTEDQKPKACSGNILNKFVCWYVKCLRQRPFCTSFVTLIILYLPYIIFSYPSIFMGDSPLIIASGYNEDNQKSNMLSSVLLNSKVKLTQWQPIPYVLFVHGCIVFGRTVLHSDNAGIFLVSVSQLILAITVISYTVRFMVRRNVRTGFIIFLLLYFSINFRITNYTFLLSKEAFYAYLLLLLVIVISDTLSGGQNPFHFILICLLAFLVITMRSEARYLIIPLFFVTGIVAGKKLRKRLWVSALILICLVTGYQSLLKTLYITPVSKAEMLSVPFQQTARYVRDHSDEVTKHEHDVIDTILGYDDLAERYDSHISDPVKDKYNVGATGAQLKEYFRVWFSMLLKHPGTYIQATMSNYYDYFYINKDLECLYYNYVWSEDCMNQMKTYMKDRPLHFHYPENQSLTEKRHTYGTLNHKLLEWPIIGLLNKAGFYTWAFIIWVSYILRKKNRKWIPTAFTLFLMVMVMIVAPTGGYYFRYTYAFAVTLPVVMILSQIQSTKEHN